MKETLEFVLDREKEEKIKDLIKKGYRYVCVGCGRVYKEKRRELYEDGHGGHFIDICSCGCDLFKNLEELTCLAVKVKPVRKTLIFKEHHAKYCQCEKGEFWTGNAETECHAEFDLLEHKGNKKIFRCLKSGFKIVILKSTEQELNNPDELGSTYLRVP